MGWGGDISDGFQRGLTRAAEEFRLHVDSSNESINATNSYLHEVIDQWPFDLSGPFVRYIAEAIGIASAARLANGYPALTRDQVIGYIAHSADILDSLKHA